MSWDDICSKCGLCCREKAIDGKYLIFFDSYCQFYNSSSGLCSVYNERFKKCKACRKVNIFRAAFASYLPPTCSYVIWAKKHHIRFAFSKEVVLAQSNEEK